jgi:serine/threonine protein kinase
VPEETDTSSSILGGRYELRTIIGSGGMATVWRAVDTRLQRDVAVKILSHRLSSDDTFQRRFAREARHVASLSDPNIVSVFDFGIDGDQAYIVMELVVGQSLRSLLNDTGTLTGPVVMALARDVLKGLAHAHEAGLVHRDIKPANILITSTGRAEIADFGIARSHGDTTEIATQGLFTGTLVYSSPEQLAGDEVGPPSDLYAVGCVLYECLMGQPPFSPDDVAKAVMQHRFAEPKPITAPGDVPPRMIAAIMRSLEKDPRDRFQTASAMMAELLDTERTITQVSPLRPLPVPRKTRGRYAVLAAFVALVAVVGIVKGETRPPRSSQQSQMIAGDMLKQGQFLRSPDGRYQLTMERNGDLVLTARSSGAPIWASGSAGHAGAYAILQGDGNLIVYPKGRSAPRSGQRSSALFQSKTSGHPGAKVDLQNDGDLTLRSDSNGAVLWESGSVPGSEGSQLLSGDQLHPSQYLQSPNGMFRLENVAGQGVLRLVKSQQPGCTVWQAPAHGVAASVATMQSDGNLVLYAPGASRVTWQTHTSGHNGADLVLENSGSLVLASSTGVVLWQVDPMACSTP